MSTRSGTKLGQVQGETTQKGFKAFFELYDQDELLEQISTRLEKSLSAAYEEFPNSAMEMENAGFEKSYKIVEGKHI